MKESAFKNALFTILSQSYPMCIGYARHEPAIDAIVALAKESGAELEIDVIEVAPVVVEEEKIIAENADTQEKTDEAAQTAESKVDDVSDPADEPVSDGNADDSEAADEADQK